MLLSTIVLASGVIYAGRKLYQHRARVKKALAEKDATTGPLSPGKEKNNKTFSAASRQTNTADKIDPRKGLATNAIISGGALAAVVAIGPFFPPIRPLVAIPVCLYASRPGIKRVISKWKRGILGSDVLNVLTIFGALIFGFYSMALFALFIWSVAQRFIIKVHNDSHNRLIDVFGEMPTSVWITVDNVELSIPLQELKAGDIVVVHSGEIIPADGAVIRGIASVDQQVLTGEARPVDKGVDDEVFASTLVLSGQIHFRVEKAGDETTVAKVGNILNSMIDFKSEKELRAEQLADKTTIPTLVAGGLAFPILGSSGALAVLGSHFTNKMRMIASLSTMNYLNISSRNGVLIKDGRAFEWLQQVDTIIFDKTGTLTEEQPTVGAIHANTGHGENGWTEDDVLRYAVIAEYKQTHPIARAIIQAAKNRNLSIPVIDDTEYRVGYGRTVRAEGRTVRIGSRRFMEMQDIPIPATIQEIEEASHQEGHSLVMVSVDDRLMGAIELLPTIRPEAEAVIRQLRQLPQIKATYIISGDQEAPTRKLAEILGIDHYFAETLPENKARIIEQLQQDGKFICYVGDGINDAIALKQADVSISLRGASTVATDCAEIILLDKGLQHLHFLFDIARSYNRNMDVTLALVIAPTFIGIGGAYLVGFGFGHTVFLSITALLTGTGSAMFPLFFGPSRKYKHLAKPETARGEEKEGEEEELFPDNGHDSPPKYTLGESLALRAKQEIDDSAGALALGAEA